MADAQGFQIGNQAARIAKGEAAIELQAIGGKRTVAVAVGRQPIQTLGEPAGLRRRKLGRVSHPELI